MLRAEARFATRQRVLAVAAELFRQHGFADTSIRDIAETSGVSVGTVIGVGDKNALLVRVFDDLVAGEHDRQQRPVPPVADDTAESRVAHLVDLVQPFVSMFTSHPNLARTYASILVSGAHDSRLFADSAGRLTQEFEVTVGPTKARALYFAYVGVLFTWAAGQSTDSSEITAQLHDTFAAICTSEEAP